MSDPRDAIDRQWLAGGCELIALLYDDGAVHFLSVNGDHDLTDDELEDLQGFVARALELRAEKEATT